MTKPVDTKLREFTGYLLRRASSAALPEINRLLGPFGLRRTTFSALAVVTENPGLSQSQLAKALSIERPNMVQIIDVLEKSKLLERKPAPNDRRTNALQATPKGVDLLERSHATLQQYENELTAGMSGAEIQTLRHLLSLVEENALRAQKTAEESLDELEISSA